MTLYPYARRHGKHRFLTSAPQLLRFFCVNSEEWKDLAYQSFSENIEKEPSLTETLSDLVYKTLDDIQPPFRHTDFVSLSSLLISCGNDRCLQLGHVLHSYIIQCDMGDSVFLGNLILRMYGRCEVIKDACAWFDQMPEHDQHSWNFIISTCTRNNECELALGFYDQLCVEGMVVDEYISSSIFSACAKPFQGRRIHACIVSSYLASEEVVQNALLNFYARCEEDEEYLHYVWRLFHGMQEKGVISWSSMIAACSKHGLGNEAICLWKRMQQESVCPNKATILVLLDACGNKGELGNGKQLHACLLTFPFQSKDKTFGAMISMYGKCGDMDSAMVVFEAMAEKNVISWTAMIAGYVQNGHAKEGFQLFDQMEKEGIPANQITFVTILDAFRGEDDLERAKQMHALIRHSKYDSDVIVATAIVKMYGKCDSPKDARRTFDGMPDRNLVSWNAMISVYAQHGLGKKASELFALLLQKGIKPDKVTFISMLSACANEGSLIDGKWMHDRLVRLGHDRDIVVSNAILNMYAKCGDLVLARNVFERISKRNVISWSSMIAAYAQHGHAKEVLPMLHQMKEEGVHPNKVTFKVILYAYSHAGLLSDAYLCLNSMSKEYGLKPDVEHYDSVVDLIGRVGKLEELDDFIMNIPIQPSQVSWLTLLGSCSSRADLSRAERAASQIFEMYPTCCAPYVILSNMYVAAGMDLDAQQILASMKQKGLMRHEDVSYIEVNGKVEEFSTCNDLKSYTIPILEQLEILETLVKDAGISDTWKNKNANESVDEYGPCCHTIRLAIACGFTNTCPNKALTIVTSVQMCGGCHSFSKNVSKISDREIVISDSCFFHHMQNGCCSCGNSL